MIDDHMTSPGPLEVPDPETAPGPTSVDLPRVEAAVRELLDAIGEDAERNGLLDTPARVARMYAEVCGGLHEDPRRHLRTTFDADHDEMIMVRDIPVYSMCEHHLLPFLGKAHVAYIPKPGGRITGLSKLARLVDGFARRPQVQERLTRQILVALQELLDTDDVAVSIEATHYCVKSRGIMDSNSQTSTTALGGCFRENIHTRAEFLDP